MHFLNKAAIQQRIAEDQIDAISRFEEPELHSRMRVSSLMDTTSRSMTRGLEIENLDESNLSQIGLDLRVGGEVYQEKNGVRADLIDSELYRLEKDGEIKRLKPKNGRVVLRASPTGKKIYYIPSLERIQLPHDLGIHVDAKSTTGRTGTMCTDKTKQVLELWHLDTHPVIIAVQPYAFDLEIELGKTRLSQAVLYLKRTDP